MLRRVRVLPLRGDHEPSRRGSSRLLEQFSRQRTTGRAIQTGDIVLQYRKRYC